MAHKMFNPPHPGRVLKDALDSNGLSDDENAASLGISAPYLRAIYAGEADITQELSERLARLMGSSEGLWIRLQAKHDEWRSDPRSKTDNLEHGVSQ